MLYVGMNARKAWKDGPEKERNVKAMTNEKLRQLKDTLAFVRKLLTMDIYFSIFDENCVVQYIDPEDGDKDGIFVGEVFHDPTGKLEEAMQSGESIHNILPMKGSGNCMEGNIVPVYEEGKICGAVSSVYFPASRQQLTARELALQSVYYLILAVHMENGHCNRIYFNYERHRFPADVQHFDVFCQKLEQEVHPEDLEEFREFVLFSRLHQRMEGKKDRMLECRLLDRSGAYRWMELVFIRVEEPENEAYEDILFMVRDIHERKQKTMEALEENQALIMQLQGNNDALLEQSLTDELTQLYNRKGMTFFGFRLLREAKDQGRYIYTFVADLNGLKSINDNCGHREGDQAIRVIAKQLTKAAPDYAVVCRTGGDEFTIMAVLDAGSTVPEEIERSFVKQMEEYNRTSGLPYQVKASYGWEMRPGDIAGNLDECFNAADRKMYEMKEQGRIPGCFSVKAQKEIARRFGSARHKVLVFSLREEVRREIMSLFDDNYQIVPMDTKEEVYEQLEETRELVLLFVDRTLGEPADLTYLKNLPETLRKKAVIILLLPEEDEEFIEQAFSLGVDDVLTAPYATELNRWHMKHLIRVNIAARKLSGLLEAGL